MKTLAIYGAGGMGREIADLAMRINLMNQYWNKIVFIDDMIKESSINHLSVFSFDDFLKHDSLQSTQVIISSGEPSVREYLYQKVRAADLELVNIIEPEFIKSEFTNFGIGNLVHYGTVITCNIEIGNNNLINKQVVLGHDVILGDHCVVSPHVTVGGNTIIKDHVFIGSGAVIRNGITIDENCIIGMGAVVTKDIPNNSVVVGNPGKVVRENTTKKVFH